MIRLLWIWLVSAVGLLIVAHLGIGIHARSVESVAVAALVLGLVNTFIRPILRLIALPFTLLTFGLLGWVINGLMLWLVSRFVPGFFVTGLEAAVIGAILLAIISGVVHWIVRR